MGIDVRITFNGSRITLIRSYSLVVFSLYFLCPYGFFFKYHFDLYWCLDSIFSCFSTIFAQLNYDAYWYFYFGTYTTLCMYFVPTTILGSEIKVSTSCLDLPLYLIFLKISILLENKILYFSIFKSIYSYTC